MQLVVSYLHLNYGNNGKCRPDVKSYLPMWESAEWMHRHFWPFVLLWPWPWPDDLNIRTWPILPGDILDVQIWTSYVKAFKSYRLTDRQTESTEIINHATSRVVRYVTDSQVT